VSLSHGSHTGRQLLLSPISPAYVDVILNKHANIGTLNLTKNGC